MAECIANPTAENVRLQIMNYLQQRLGNEGNPKRALNGFVNDDGKDNGKDNGKDKGGEFLLRNFRQYQDKICLQSKGAVVFQNCIQNISKYPSTKDKINVVKSQYEANGFTVREPEGNYGCFSRKKYKNADWETGVLPIATLEEIAQDFANIIEITKSFEDLLVLRGSNKTNTKGSKALDTVTLEARNRIYFGAPGTGKSYKLNKDVKDVVGEDNVEDNIERVTFYPTYSYQQFVGAYKPFVKKIVEKNNQGQDVVRDEITYKFVPGPLMRLLVKAWKAEEDYRQARKKLDELNSEEEQDQVAINAAEAQVKANCFVLIVEELNRAEAAAVFGDFFQLLDRDENNGKSEYEISPSEELRLALGWDEKKKLYLPENFFIWATMNNADQGVMPLDTAFKRRWEFEYIGLDNGEDKLKAKASKENLWNNLRKNINEGLRKLAVNEDKLLGPFFMKAKGLTKKAFWKTFCDKVVLYLYEDAARLRRKDCFKGSNITYSDLRKKLVMEFEDWEHCQETLEDVFSFEITNKISEKDWPWPPQAKDGPTENETDDKPSVGDSGAQGESTSDNT